MKKLLSLILTAAMLLSMGICAFAENITFVTATDQFTTFEKNLEFNSSRLGTGGSATTATGKFGKAAADTSAVFTVSNYNSGANGRWAYIYKHNLNKNRNTLEPLYLNDGVAYNGYFVMDFNFMFDGNGTREFIQLLTGTQQEIAYIYEDDSNYKANQWNNIRMVYDPTGHGVFLNDPANTESTKPASGTKLGTFKTYLNGQLIKTSEVKTSTSYPYSGVNDAGYINLFAGNTPASTTYFDDLKIYISETGAAPVMPVLTSGEKFTVEDKNIRAKSDATVADIAAGAASAGYTASVYADDSYSASLGENATLAPGNMVVVSDGTRYSYYNVVDSTIVKLEMTDNFTSFTRRGGSSYTGSIGNTTKVAGKESSDNSGLFTIGAQSGNRWYYCYKNTNSEGTVEPIYLHNGKGYDGYLVVDFNFMIDETKNPEHHIIISSSGNMQVMAKITTAETNYKHNAWNNVRFVYDPTGHGVFKNDPVNTNDTAPAADTLLGTVTTYLNGEILQKATEVKATSNYPYAQGYDAGWIYISGEQVGTTNEAAAYFDDLKIYITDTNSAPVMPEAVKAAKYNVADNTLYIKNDAALKLSDIATNSEDYTVEAYSDNTFATKLADNAVLGANNVVMMTDGTRYSYYAISVFDATVSGTAVTASLTDALKGNCIIIAEYEGNKLIGVKLETASANGDLTANYTITNNTNTVRAFLLNSMTDITPLSTSIPVK